MGYRLSAKAEEDLIRLYLDGSIRFGRAQAEFYYDDLVRTFGLLAENPRAAHERPEIGPDIRVHPHRRHSLIYRIDDVRDVFFIRIRYRREDWI